MPIATLIASEMLASAHLSEAQDSLRDAGLEIGDMLWIENDYAVDIQFNGSIAAGKAALHPLANSFDFVVQEESGRDKNLLISDMDSTMITVECIDELADYAGIKDQIAEVTERAMQGEIDFEEALLARVVLLRGLERRHIETCLQERVTMTAGAKTLVQTMANRGAYCVLVSGGFTQFAQSVAQQLGFHEYHANQLAVIDDMLSVDIIGDIVDAQRKQDILHDIIKQNGWSANNVLAVGDGANDIPMIKAAGLGVAYHAKEAAEKAADMMIKHNDLSVLLYAQGISRDHWITSSK